MVVVSQFLARNIHRRLGLQHCKYNFFVAMEVAWRGPADDHRQLSCAGAVFEMKKERRSTAWGVDAQKVVQLMMGQLQYSADSSTNTAAAAAACCTGAAGDDVTLDLLGGAAGDQDVGPSMRRSIISDDCTSGGTSTEFDLMELDPEQPRLPFDWRKCLDLKVALFARALKASSLPWQEYSSKFVA